MSPLSFLIASHVTNVIIKKMDMMELVAYAQRLRHQHLQVHEAMLNMLG
jgi:hypothetical protein